MCREVVVRASEIFVIDESRSMLRLLGIVPVLLALIQSNDEQPELVGALTRALAAVAHDGV